MKKIFLGFVVLVISVYFLFFSWENVLKEGFHGR